MNARLTIYTLGQTSILLDGHPITGLTSRTAEALLVYLMHQHRPVSRQVLADFFWDDRRPERGAANLRTLLTMLRKSLGDYLLINRHTVAFNHKADYWLDAAVLEQGLARLAHALERTEPLDAETRAGLGALLDLYRGDFLEGFFLSESRAFEEWTLQIQARLRHQVAMALRRLVAACLDEGDYQAGIQFASHLLAIDSFDESAHRQLMWLSARSGHRNAALEQYQRCRELLAAELGVEPARATTALYERFRTITFPPRLCLPVESSLFVGREAELAEIKQQLCNPTCKLLTILGPGGMGKTRLAIESASQLHHQRPGAFLNGIYFVPLADIASADLLSTAVADTLRLPFEGGRAAQEQLLAYLRDKELLLLLDNAEHLVDEPATVDFISTLLAEAPGITLLVTARAPLRLREEWLFDLAGLACPPAGSPPTRDELEQYAAVQLFVRHAARFQRAFAPSVTEWDAIGRICRLLAGAPLGLELAAAWVRRHTCVEIATQIAQDLDFLTSRLHNMQERHRSLRAVFTHSWRLLTTADQAALCRLAVFPGQIDPAAAYAVARVTADQLDTLADQSLLRRLEGSGAFAMHAMIRHYALEKLAADPALEARTWQRFCHYYANFMAQRADALKGRGQQAALQAVNSEAENVRLAWRVAVAERKRVEVDQMLDALFWYQWQRGYFQEGRQLLTTAIATLSAGENHDDLLLARVQRHLADYETWLADYDRAATLFDACIPVLRRAEAWVDLGWALDGLGQIAYAQGSYGVARGHFQEALNLFRRANVSAGIAHSLTTLANLFCDEQTDYPAAASLYEKSLALYRALGDEYGEAKVIINLGAMAHDQGDYSTASDYYRQGIAICRALGHRQTLAIVLNNLGQALSEQGEVCKAAESLAESAALRRELGDRRGLALTLMSLGNLTAKQNTQRQTQQHYAEALRVGRDLASSGLLADLLLGLADVLGNWGEISWAAMLLTVIMRDAAEGELLRQKAHSILAGLAAKDPSAVAAGQAQAGAVSLPAALDEALVWLTT